MDRIRLYLGGIPADVTEEDIRGRFEPDFGSVENICIALDKDSGINRMTTMMIESIDV